MNKSRYFHEYLFYPSTQTMKLYVKGNQINNCSITVDDINRSKAIYGSSVPYLQDHMIRRNPFVHRKIEKIPLPPLLKLTHPALSLFMNFLRQRKCIIVDFTTSQFCTSRSLRTIIASLEKIIHKYKSRLLKLTTFHGDPKFDKSEPQNFLEPSLLHIYAAIKHIGNIEQSTRRIKEHVRSTCNGIPYKRITIIMVISLIESIVEIINLFPSSTGISKTMIPGTLVEGKAKPNVGAKMISFGSYAFVYLGTSNNMKRRLISVITLRKSNNNGWHYFMNLYTRRRIHGYHWTKLPIDDYVISRIEELAKNEKQPIMHDGVPTFEWSPGNNIGEYNIDKDVDFIEQVNKNQYMEKLMDANQEDPNDGYDHEENINGYLMPNNNEVANDEQVDILQDVAEGEEDNNAEGLDIVPNDHIVSKYDKYN